MFYVHESLAAPDIIAHRIVEDLLYTIDPIRARNRNLIEALESEEADAGLPTKNLLRLTTEERQLLRLPQRQ